MRHLGMFAGRSAAGLARAEHRPLDQVEPILQRLSEEKRVIVAQRLEGEEPLPAHAAHAGHVRDGLGPPVAGFADRLAPPLRRVVRGPLRDRLHGGLSRADDALGAVPAGGQGHRGPSPGAAGGPVGSGPGPVRRLRRRAVPMPHCHRRGRPRLRQAQGQLRRDGPLGQGRHQDGRRSARSASRRCSTSSARPRPTAWSTGS